MEERRIPPLRAGRRPAGRALLGWRQDDRAPRLCRVTGSPGSGRTHLLAWLAAACTDPATPHTQRVHSLLPAAGLTVRSATWLMAAQLNVPARTPGDLVAALEQDARTTVVCVADLHLAGGPGLPDEPQRLVSELLDPLLALPHLRMVVDAATGSALADAFTAVADPAVLDLDDPQWTDRERFAAWYAASTRGHSAFTADQVYPNPGLALLAARTPQAPSSAGDAAAGAVGAEAAASAKAVDAEAAAGAVGAETAGTAAGGAEAEAVCRAWWAAVPENARAAVAALAAVDRPIGLDAWTALYGEAEAVREAARWLPAATPAADGWWLRPLPLPSVVAATEPDHTAAVRSLARTVPRADGGGPDLPSADPDRLSLLLTHTLLAGNSGELLSDPAFLVHAHPVAVTAALEAGTPNAALAAAWHAAGPALVEQDDPAVRAAVLRTRLLGRDDTAAERLAPTAAGAGWQAQWAQWRPAAGSAGRWPGPVAAAAAGTGPYAGQLLLADPTGAVRILSAADGHPTGRIAVPEPRPLRSLACAPGGSVVLLDVWGVPEVLAPADQGAQVGARIQAAFDAAAPATATAAPAAAAGSGVPAGLEPYHLTAALDLLRQRAAAELSAVACLAGLPSEPPAVGDVEGRVHWREERHRLHRGPVTALSGVALPADAPVGQGVPLLVSGGLDGCVRLWGPGADPMPEPWDARPCPVTAVAAVAIDRGLVVAAAWADGLLRVRRLDDVGTELDLRLGCPVTALVLSGDAQLVAGTPDGVAALRISG
ncbi:hypothetical protein [Peterkaempfera bronchialis]|uniref:Uncharacterized protein n=1 Tax=Peterkaempfera bronchialis TaxID=2126346 RepID=A0A345T2Q8_9ACTN|nr:hypothetical protein [Peterkaempfera bronchialis]AXI80263.1 hypothetical protein C7M71_025560 [Peterkaempfera bronchialis]